MRSAASEITTERAFTRRLLLRASALIGVCLLPGLAGCDSDRDAPPTAAGAAPLPPSPPPERPDVLAEVTFKAAPGAVRLDSRFAGLSYEKTKLVVPMFTGANAALIKLFGLLGPAVLRIGANAVDRSSWSGDIQGLTPILPAQIDALAAFARATQWKLIYGVNLARNTPANAAREAAYVAARLGQSLLAWEIGNEPDLYRQHGYRPADWGYREYLGEWREFQRAMSEAAPGVAFSGPGTAFELEDNTLLFARDERHRLAMLTHHYYRADRDDSRSTLALLLQTHADLTQELTDLVKAASDNDIPLGARLTEANSFHGGGLPRASDALGSALWGMDFMFNCAVAGCHGVNMHSGNRGSYTPIADVDGEIVETRPLFYGLMMFAQAAQGLPLTGMVATDATINVSAWGIQREDSGFSAVLMNKDDRRSVGMNLNTGSSAERFEPLWLKGTSLGATTGQTLGGVAIGTDGSWTPQTQSPLTASGGQFNVLMPPASAVLVRSV